MDSENKNIGGSLMKSIKKALSAVRLASGDPTALFGFVRKSKAAKIAIPSLIALILTVGVIIPYYKAQDVLNKISSIFDILNPKYNAVTEEYMQLARQSVDTDNPNQIRYMLDYRVIAAADIIIYEGSSTRTEKYQIMQNLKPEFHYIDSVTIYSERTEIIDADGNIIEVVEDWHETRKINEKLTQSVYAYNGAYFYQYVPEGRTSSTVSELDEFGFRTRKLYKKEYDLLEKIVFVQSYDKIRRFINRYSDDIGMFIDPEQLLKEIDEKIAQMPAIDESEHGGGIGTPISCQNIRVVNNTQFLSNPEHIKEVLNMDIFIPPLEKFSDKPQVLIYHTHTDEAYAGSKNSTNPSHSTDPAVNILSVGTQLKEEFMAMGINALHCTKYHVPADGAYGRSLGTVQQMLNDYPSIKLVLDIHRDGLSGKPGDKLETAVMAGNPAAPTSKLMFVVGSNATLYHPKWIENYALALKVHNELINRQDIPDIMRYTNIRKERFNQHTSVGAMLIEVGADGDTADAAKNSTKYIVEALINVVGTTEG